MFGRVCTQQLRRLARGPVFYARNAAGSETFGHSAIIVIIKINSIVVLHGVHRAVHL